jgi:hypothetical protein
MLSILAVLPQRFLSHSAVSTSQLGTTKHIGNLTASQIINNTQFLQVTIEVLDQLMLGCVRNCKSSNMKL